ncbi:hypothetical protein GTQ34_16575 [Muricauda sp. JGD-17]|uniref:Lipoprotein n=1 Tax=Flagellimonas ochracea TaxID=2696472 RepID=A0A964TFF0_9FLAO|nr:hypothetical protein [Allomuricauda ochracea]NAY93524.1 hypothetical protein [Allomuricauda ochracea]
MRNRLKPNHLVLVTFLISLLGCKSRDEQIASTIEGSYILNKIEHQGFDITSEVIAAILSFNTDDNLKFKPPIINRKVGKSEMYDWLIIEEENEIKIKFDTNNKIFKDVFNVSFKIDDSSKQIHLFMKSSSTHISATRVFLAENFEDVKRKLILIN